jgi:hypothetical protein
MKQPFRTRSVGTKVSEEEYAQLESCALSRRLSISEWCRAVLLDKAEGPRPSSTDHAVLAEVFALRTILLNLHFAVAKGDVITAEQMQAIIERADGDKEKRAAQRLATISQQESPEEHL